MAARLLIIAFVAAVMAGCGGPTPAPVQPVAPTAVVAPAEETAPVTTKFCSFTLTSGVTLQGLVVADNKKDITIRTEDGDLTIAKAQLAKTAPAALPQAFDQELVSGVEEGIESLPGWNAADWSNPGTVTVEKISGDLRLRIKAESGAAEKSAVRVATGLDLSTNAALTMDVFNPSQASTVVALAVVTGEGKVYYESQPMEVPFGWSRNLTVALAAAQFKSEASGWEYTAALADPGTVSELYVLVYNGEQPVEIVVNNLFVK
ncbi:MAG: hypothetical protein ABIF71_02600 [Planctomycetota bacterium]